jgi:DNA mismatch endonuclease (patch repair protein)
MADVFSKAKRSEIMSHVQGHGNERTELALASLLRRSKLSGWRRNQPVFGKPDFVFREQRVAVFVDGCFWHGCPAHATKPATNRAFWCKKLARNKARDQLVTRTLRAAGWRVLRVWEHELVRKREARLVTKLRKALPGAT